MTTCALELRRARPTSGREWGIIDVICRATPPSAGHARSTSYRQSQEESKENHLEKNLHYRHTHPVIGLRRILPATEVRRNLIRGAQDFSLWQMEINAVTQEYNWIHLDANSLLYYLFYCPYVMQSLLTFSSFIQEQLGNNPATFTSVCSFSHIL